MAKRNNKTASTFTALLATIGKTATAQRNDIQKAVKMAIDHFNKHGDVCYLDRLYTVAVQARSVKANLLLSYMLRSCSCKYNKSENTFSQKSGEREVLPLVGKWYEVDDADKVIKPIDAVARITSLIKQLEAGIEGKDGKSVTDATQATHVITALKAELESVTA